MLENKAYPDYKKHIQRRAKRNQILRILIHYKMQKIQKKNNYFNPFADYLII